MLTVAPQPNDMLDAGVTGCGDLVLMIAQRMRQLEPGKTLHVVAYDRGAARDIPAWCRMTGNTFCHQDVPDDPKQSSQFYIRKGS
jgi:tRNA 2-thiouridine synthesizing protein A